MTSSCKTCNNSVDGKAAQNKRLTKAPPLAHYACMTAKKNPAAVSLGRLGGRVKGPCKARTSEQARKAALIRWQKEAKP